MPADHTLPLSGGWIMITRELPTEVKPPLLSMFYALPDRLFPQGWHTARFGDFGAPSQSLMTLLWRSRAGGRLLPHERQEIEPLKDFELDQRARIQTDDGDVWVEPHEWVPIPDIGVYFGMIDGDDIKLHLQAGAKPTGTVGDQIFYMRSRGLSRLECYLLLLGEIKRPNICWLEIHPDYADFFLAPRKRKRTINTRMKVEMTI